jgi:hypothetical protein
MGLSSKLTQEGRRQEEGTKDMAMMNIFFPSIAKGGKSYDCS